MLRYLPFVLVLAITIYALVDCARRTSTEHLPRELWALIIIFLPFAGAAAYLIVERPAPTQRRHLPPARPPVLGPDDDPEFLQTLYQPTEQPQPSEKSPPPVTETGDDDPPPKTGR